MADTPESIVSEKDIICLQHQQIRVVLLLCILVVAVVKLQPLGSPGRTTLGTIRGARAIFRVLGAVLAKARPGRVCTAKCMCTCMQDLKFSEKTFWQHPRINIHPGKCAFLLDKCL